MRQLQYIKHIDIDFKKWDIAILSSEFPLVFAQSFYLNATSPNWDALVIGDYECVFPLTIKSKFGFRYLPQPPFTSQLGAFGKVNSEYEQLFFNYILSNFKLIELELNASNKLISEYISPKKTFIIKYGNEYKLNQNSKRNIARAEENSFEVKQIPDTEVLNLSQKLLNPFLLNDLHLPTSHIALFEQLLCNAQKEKMLYSFKTTDKFNKTVAIAHFVSNGKHTLFLKGTNFDKAENSGSMHLLINFAVNYFADKSVLFDFGGGSNSEGLANFYKGLGGEIQSYSFLRVNKLPWLIKLIKNKK